METGNSSERSGDPVFNARKAGKDKRPSQFQNAPFCPISASGSNFDPRNTQCIPVVNPAMAGAPSLILNKIEHFETASTYQHIAQFPVTRHK